ncbi:MAG TPA: sugar kinase [Mesorhizobium sp.]|nr:sugar kinase [Mesorhizobium sp.]
MDAAYDLACLGEPLLELNRRPGDEGASLYLEAHGGDASNVAIAAARQGARTAFLSAVGDDLAGRSFLQLWAHEGVDASAAQVDPERPTGLYFVSHDAQGHHFTYLRKGSAASAYRLDEAAREAIRRAKIAFASGISLAISAQAADAVFEAMALAGTSGRRVAFDTNYRAGLWPPARAAALVRQAMSLSNIAFPGLEDMQALFGLSDPEEIVRFCLSLGPEAVALKMGSEGALLAMGEQRIVMPPFPARPVDATGAGDTFCGAFLARFAEGASLQKAGRYAACAAALATQGFGAVPPIPRRETVEAALAGAR